ncbi:K02A2.6-like [Cordylochernes scorpioides]|uniref:RNA-directed DNA polymerase n=1 Tax=Cordylochernes scorpioides TaxID=51811 RepID=A0ABY6K5S4_9ARAC|nr:K02A2.6-like [Cordylochernes scorpioides]
MIVNAITNGQVLTFPPTPVRANEIDKQSILTHYARAFDDTVLKPMQGPPMSIELVKDAVPCKRYRAYNVPFHWRDPVKTQLDTMLAKGIIEQVPVGEAIDWCHPMVVVPKKGSSEPRVTVDLTGLNKYVRRPAYPVRVPREVVARIPPGMQFFSTLDALHGYWQVPLDEKSKKLTTFITPWGNYRYCRNVMGLCSAGDEHNRRGDEALFGIQNVEKVVEDIIIFDSDYKTHVQRVRQVISRCQEHGITLNQKKFVFAQPEVDWCGFRINSSGYTPSPHLYSALKNFPIPTNKTDVRSFNGLVQQFEAFSHHLTELSAPIRSLLSAKAAFVWENPHQRAFDAVIQELCSSRILAQFSPGQPLRLETDAAQTQGLGYALYQQQPDSQWRLLQVGSRNMTPAESRYSATEIELLAVVWAAKKCKLFLMGSHFELIVDHRPLIPILNSKTLDEIENPRLLRLKEKLTPYLITAVWRPGKKHTVVDVLSRHPSPVPDVYDTDDHPDSDPAPLIAAAVVDPVDGSRVMEDSLIRQIRAAAEHDGEYKRIRNIIPQKIQRKEDLDEDLRPYWRVLHQLSVREELVFLGSRLLIPTPLRSEVLKILHASHQGQDRTLRRAGQSVFWPSITNDIRNVVKTCAECSAYLPSQQKEPLYSDPPPSYPFQHVSCDLFSHAGYQYLVMVDRFSGWINVTQCGRAPTSTTVIRHLQKWMADYGIPEILTSDNGPQFSSQEFRSWTKRWNIEHSTSSPHFPQSNGLAESAVKAIKYLISKTTTNGNLKSDTFLESLMEFRNTPKAEGRSPAQIVFGAPTRTKLPLHRSQFAKEWRTRISECDQRAQNLRQKALKRYNRNAKPLSQLEVGAIVLVQDHRTKHWTLIAEVLEQLPRGRSYLIRTDAGRLLRRNRRFLRPFVPPPYTTPPNSAQHQQTLSPRTREPNPRERKQSLFDRMKEVLKIPLEMDFDSFADADNDVVTNAMLSDVEIVESILQAKEEEETDQVDEEVDPIVHIPHPKEVLESIQTLRLFLQCQDESKSLHRHLSDLDNIGKSVQHLLLTSKCQKKITNYFSKNT